MTKVTGWIRTGVRGPTTIGVAGSTDEPPVEVEEGDGVGVGDAGADAEGDAVTGEVDGAEGEDAAGRLGMVVGSVAERVGPGVARAVGSGSPVPALACAGVVAVPPVDGVG